VGIEQRSKQQVEADGGAEKLGQVGGDSGNLRGQPETDGGAAGEVSAAVLRQGEAGDDAKLGGKILDEHRHHVRPEQDPEQAVAELRATQDVGSEVAGVDVRHRGYEGRTEIGPHLVAPGFGRESAGLIRTWEDFGRRRYSRFILSREAALQLG
jgi:hypothetical protein